MPFELKRAPFHPIYGYNSPHLPYGTDPVEEVVEVPVEAVEESGDAHTFSETVEVEHETEPTDAEGDVLEPAESADEGDIVGYSSLQTPESIEAQGKLEEILTSQNEYRSDDPLGLDGLSPEDKGKKIEEAETSQNDYRADDIEDHVEG
jgi:hypothetical protein